MRQGIPPHEKRKEQERELVVRLTPEICYIDLAFPRRRGAARKWIEPSFSFRREDLDDVAFTSVLERNWSRIKEKLASFPYIRHFLLFLAVIRFENVHGVTGPAEQPLQLCEIFTFLYLQASYVYSSLFLIVRIPYATTYASCDDVKAQLYYHWRSTDLSRNLAGKFSTEILDNIMRSHHEISNQTRVTTLIVSSWHYSSFTYMRENKCAHTLRTREYVGLHLEN